MLGCQAKLLPSGLSPTIQLLFGCRRKITPLSIGAGCPFLMHRAAWSLLMCFLLGVGVECSQAENVAFYTDFSLFDLPCRWLVGRFGRRGKQNEYSCWGSVMGNYVLFGAVSGDRLPREKDRREIERESSVVLSGGELDGGRRATTWVSPQWSLLPCSVPYCQYYWHFVRPACFRCSNLLICPDSIKTRPVRSLYCTAVVFHLMWLVYFSNHICHFGCQCWEQLLYSKVCHSPQHCMLYNLCTLHGLFILQSELSRVQFEAKMCQGVSATGLFMFVIRVPCTLSLCAVCCCPLD